LENLISGKGKNEVNEVDFSVGLTAPVVVLFVPLMYK